jgi:hypothetical protein
MKHPSSITDHFVIQELPDTNMHGRSIMTGIKQNADSRVELDSLLKPPPSSFSRGVPTAEISNLS